jgi:hypothetical protein
MTHVFNQEFKETDKRQKMPENGKKRVLKSLSL